MTSYELGWVARRSVPPCAHPLSGVQELLRLPRQRNGLKTRMGPPRALSATGIAGSAMPAKDCDVTSYELGVTSQVLQVWRFLQSQWH